MSQQHVLVIGGTGMLAGVSRYLAKEGCIVSVIGRTILKLDQLIEDCPPHSIYPIQADYNTNEIFTKVIDAIKNRGPFSVIVSWTPNYQTLERICELNEQENTFRLIHVKGSRRYFDDEEIRIPLNCNYEKVFLGFVMEAGNTRWLTHEEIADGVIQQMLAPIEDRIVGQLHPYSQRPS
ncbi:Rossmann-fold NAD(P)-binding domain-containing protein [Sporosarcina saromensis]|uniref:Short-chain dehydrogenase n=1 Tax=Sporosarcina saromensis TaxID=359365 RepID=A0ABU4G4V9_9BACL|nr:short-chain dehydrogenase [Sporosarcina saromensis]MDW0112008.1 short-chain dehydrogenase [Sporosarcina saromensis]